MGRQRQHQRGATSAVPAQALQRSSYPSKDPLLLRPPSARRSLRRVAASSALAALASSLLLVAAAFPPVAAAAAAAQQQNQAHVETGHAVFAASAVDAFTLTSSVGTVSISLDATSRAAPEYQVQEQARRVSGRVLLSVAAMLTPRGVPSTDLGAFTASPPRQWHSQRRAAARTTRCGN